MIKELLVWKITDTGLRMKDLAGGHTLSLKGAGYDLMPIAELDTVRLEVAKE